jgi:hypothetical protein
VPVPRKYLVLALSPLNITNQLVGQHSRVTVNIPTVTQESPQGQARAVNLSGDLTQCRSNTLSTHKWRIVAIPVPRKDVCDIRIDIFLTSLGGCSHHPDILISLLYLPPSATIISATAVH